MDLDFFVKLFVGGGIVLLIFLNVWNAIMPELASSATTITLAVMFIIPLALVVKILMFGLKEDNKQEMV